ncbi:MAG: aminopeptidase [Bacteroidetes bacterium]|nr:aminopeptidase [Bacteroidota bacterium]
MTSYLLRQLRGQLHIMWNAENIHDALQSTAYTNEQKQKLKLIENICNYAYDSLGLTNHKNYTTIYNQHHKPIMFVVAACEPYALQAHDWQYPLLGNLNYKGFFDSTAAYNEMSRLHQLGYDASVGYAGGWSTLGWLKDPVLSNMLRRNEGQLAELIIHELVHGTVFKKGDERFNENFATFVSEHATLSFLKSMDRNADSIIQKYVNWRNDEIIYGNYLLTCADSLAGFYKSINQVDRTTAKN